MDGQPEDMELVMRACAGEARAFEVLVTRHYDTMFRFAFSWCRNESDAQDITQNTCIALARAIHGFQGKARFTSWLYRIVINTAIDWQRQNKRHRDVSVLDDMVPGGGADAEEQMIARDVLRQVAALPEKEKTALLLVVVEGMTHAEAAAIMQVKESTVSWYVHEARKRLGTNDKGKERRHG